jgi:hypothetical protein
MNKLIRFFKQLFCKHIYPKCFTLIRGDISGNMKSYRIGFCYKCGKHKINEIKNANNNDRINITIDELR